jgi:hypothetical protein
MALSARLLRPLAGQSMADADATDYLRRVQEADGQALEPAVRNAITAFVVGCKQDGIWSAIKRSCILMGARTLSGALTPLVGAAPTNNGPFVSGDYDRETGLKGNGSTKYLATGYANAGEGQDNFHGAVYANEKSSGVSTGFYFGAGAASNGDTILGALDPSTTNLFTRNRSSTSTSTSGRHGVGFMGTSRSVSAEYVIRGLGGNTTISVASQTPSARDIDVFRRSESPAYVDGRLAYYSFGGSLNLALLDARVSALYNAIGAAI